nr:zinc knuckle CX2CX4HX4C [Tanacetum cinerariifolium]
NESNASVTMHTSSPVEDVLIHSIDDVIAIFGVPFNSLKDIDEFTKDLEVEDGISLIATFIGKPVMLDSYTSSMCNDSWGTSSFARCLIEVNSEDDLVDVVTIGIPSLTGDGFTKETIHVEYEWRPPRCDICLVMFMTIALKRCCVLLLLLLLRLLLLLLRSQMMVSTVTTSAPKKGTTNVGNVSTSSSMLKTTGTSSKKDNISMSNSFFVLNDDEEDKDKAVEYVYDESASLFHNTKAGGNSSFTAAAG